MKIGIVCLRGSLVKWEASFIESISSQYDNLEWTQINYEHNKKHINFFWNLYRIIDEKLFFIKDYALFKTKYFKKPKIIAFDELNSNDKFDIILNLSPYVDHKSLIEHSKKGVLFFDYSSYKKEGLPIVANEFISKKNEIELKLHFKPSSRKNYILIDYVSICRDSMSYKRTLNEYFWQANSMLKRNLSELLIDRIPKSIETKSNIAPKKNTATHINSAKIVWFVMGLFITKTTNLLRYKLYFNQWILLLHTQVDATNMFDIKSYREILPPKDRFWADPFLIQRDNKYYLFVEELVYSEKLGKLAVIPLNDDFSPQEPTTILKKDYHLSYPFIFEDDGSLYMIPETSGNKDIQLYRCTEFPYKWEFERTLMDNVVAVDSTVYKQENIYWLFTNIQTNPNCSKHNDLHLFWSERLKTNQWTAYAKNPISSNINMARPAGNIFTLEDKLIRPSQNCAPYYGYGLSFCEIPKLDKQNFGQQLFKSINPDWDTSILSTHTFNRLGHIAVSDALKRRSRFF